VNPDTRNQIVKILSRLYPDPKSELHFENEFQLLIAVVLSAQCTDKKVNQITPQLFARYPDIATLAHARVVTIEKIIRPINYFRTKARNIVALAKMLESDFYGKIPSIHSDLVLLPGVGNKTANVVLSELGHAATFPVDTHVFRVARRLCLTKGKNVAAVEADLKRQFSANLWRPLHHWLIFHGRQVCKARSPLCPTCALAQLCPSRTK
jgi:endonuclease III